MLLPRQLANCSCETVVLVAWARLNRVSPERTVYSAQPIGGPQAIIVCDGMLVRAAVGLVVPDGVNEGVGVCGSIGR